MPKKKYIISFDLFLIYIFFGEFSTPIWFISALILI